jgi:hypothetical protein
MAILPIPLSEVRRRSVPRFVRLMAARHPEILTQVTYEKFLVIAARDECVVQLVALPDRQRARTFAVGQHQFIQLNRLMAPGELATQGMHELCHIWRDKPIDGAYYSDELTGGDSCYFADIFAWRVTSPARNLFDPDSRQGQLDLGGSP